MRPNILILFGIAMTALGLIALTILIGTLGGEVRDFGLILIGPIPIIVTDGAALPLAMLLVVVLFLVLAILVLRAFLRAVTVG